MTTVPNAENKTAVYLDSVQYAPLCSKPQISFVITVEMQLD